ncbi:MAG: hypothetical protein P3T54_09215 [Dehalogenimonas sp.]|uniref:Tetratricopeptide repeat protein n=1 Tax=Candidatus Dehalogenimonas loeffleri TaxID=3127115 RepID=A0ABZ2J990_9CHLR|nr:hypothetical protein [Dehalogenimonas sp.]
MENVKTCVVNRGYDIVEGAALVRRGDYYCSICREIQSAAFCVVISSKTSKAKTIGNLYLETGIAYGLGKPVIILVESFRYLPSDTIRNFAINCSESDFQTKFLALIDDVVKLKGFYFDLAELALDANDYDKAVWYYQESYLISGEKEALNKLFDLTLKLKKDNQIPPGYKKRLYERAKVFCKNAKFNFT